MESIYDKKKFFDEYAQMSRSQQGLDGAGEWHQFKALFPDLTDKNVLDLGCGYGWHCKYAVERGAKQVLGIDRKIVPPLLNNRSITLWHCLPAREDSANTIE